jgi:hypothetical protein
VTNFVDDRCAAVVFHLCRQAEVAVDAGVEVDLLFSHLLGIVPQPMDVPRLRLPESAAPKEFTPVEVTVPAARAASPS